MQRKTTLILEYQYHILNNGIKIIHREIPGKVSHCGLMVNTGSRDENESENGIAHLGAGVDAPMVVIYSNIVPLAWASPEISSRSQVLYDDPQLIGCDEVIAAVGSIARLS